MTHKVNIVEIDRIYLDNDNPRHDPIASEPEIIAYLIQEESIKRLASHIASNGGISPLERIGVTPHPSIPDAYISAEGNRRLCALKLLADPDKAGTETNKKYFRELAGKLVNISKVEVAIFSSRNAARPWVALRHEGEQDGVGTRPWNPQQKARFNAVGERPSNPNIQATLLIDYARDRKLLPQEKLNKVSVTTIARFLGNPVFRDTLGLQDRKTLTITVPQEEFDSAVTRFLTDALTQGSDVHSRTKADDFKRYAERLRADGMAPSTRGQKPTEVNALPRSGLSLSEKNVPQPRNNRSPDDRRTVIPSTFKTKISDRILKRLYDELRGLDAGTFSFAATYLLRAVIEQMTALFLKKRNNGASLPTGLHAKLASMADILETDDLLTRNKLKFLRTMASDRDSRYSPDSIGHFVHGGAVPTKENAIRMWDSLEEVIQHVLQEIENLELTGHAPTK